jgi:hypothetical protein
MLAGMMARPAATSLRTNSGVIIASAIHWPRNQFIIMKKSMRILATVLACLSVVAAYAQYGGRPGGMGGGPRGPDFGGANAKLYGNNSAFSATLEVQGDASPQQKMTGKLAVDQGKSRFEMNMGADPHMKSMGMDQMIVVTRPDRKASYMIFPSQQAYVENPIPESQAPKPESAYKVEITELGKETVDAPSPAPRPACRVLAAAAGVVRLAAAFAADNRRDLLDDFAGLNFRREIRARPRDQRTAPFAAPPRTITPLNRPFNESAMACRKSPSAAEIVNDGGHAVDGLDFFEQVARGVGGFALLRNP